MPLRKLLIRVMLFALGATAVIGALTALTGVGDNGWRIVATGIITAVATGLLLPFTFLADNPKSRREGLLGMTLVIVEFAGSLALLWEVFDVFGGYQFSESVGLTMLFLALTGLPAILMLRFASMQAPRIAGIAGLTLAAVVFILLMIATWTSTRWTSNDEWFATAGAVAGIGLLGVASLAGVGTPPRRIWRWAGVVAAIVAIAMAIVGIWQNLRSGSSLFAILVSIAAVVAHANICLFVPLTAGQKWVRVVTILAAMVTAAMCDLLVIADSYHDEIPVAANLAAAAGIIASCGTMALLVLARLNRNLDRVPVLSEIREMTLICPGCQKKQTLPVGESSCTACGLKISIRVEEPRCPKCDYLLFMLKSDRCPECGEMVRQPIAMT